MRKTLTQGFVILAALLLAAWLLLNWYYSPKTDCVEAGGQWDDTASTCIGNKFPLPEPPWLFLD